MPESVKLTEAMRSTLREMASYKEYWFRQATCKKLVSLGFAERMPTTWKTRAPHRITPAGRRALEGSRK